MSAPPITRRERQYYGPLTYGQTRRGIDALMLRDGKVWEHRRTILTPPDNDPFEPDENNLWFEYTDTLQRMDASWLRPPGAPRLIQLRPEDERNAEEGAADLINLIRE